MTPEYDIDRKFYNRDDCPPALIARCTGMEDVRTIVHHARDNKLLVAVRGGGHNRAGLGTCYDGLVIDLSCMIYMEVNPESQTVLVEGGVPYPSLWPLTTCRSKSIGPE